MSDLIYDVGMHKGEDTDFYLKKGFRVVAFEADPDLVKACTMRFSIEISTGRLIIVDGAITESQSGEPIRFYKNTENSVWGTVVDKWAQRNEFLGLSSSIIEVDPIDFSLSLLNYGVPHYMKIDIEGMDLVCLRALREFSERPNFVSIESEKVIFSKLEDEINLLSQLGYNAFKAVQQAGISSQNEPIDTLEGNYVNYIFERGSSGLFGRDLPDKWLNREEILQQYKRIFLSYKYFGDYAFIHRLPLSRYMLRAIKRIVRKPLPGWYDTHALHKDFL